MASQFDAAIQDAEAALGRTIQAMEEQTQHFMMAAVEFVRMIYMDQTGKAVSGQPEVTKGHSAEKLTELKQEVRKLQDQTEAVVKEHLNRDSQWWHRVCQQKPKKTMDYTVYTVDHRLPEQLDDGIRYAIGRLGHLLNKYGYIQGNSGWLRQQDGGTPHDRYRYQYAFDVSAEMKAPLTTYEQLRRQGENELKVLESRKSEKAQSEAAALWENA